jgi:hypothetical protein
MKTVNYAGSIQSCFNNGLGRGLRQSRRGLKSRSFFSWILPALVLALPIALEAQHIVGTEYAYTVTNGTATITQYTGPGGTVTIPAVLSGLPVTSIGTQAFFYLSSLTNVTIPDSVTSIGVGAFSDCTSLARVRMGTNVATIADTAFFNCTSLAELTIPNSVSSIGYRTFYGCSVTSLMIPNSVTSIGREAFSWSSSLTSVTIPNSVTNIGDYAFDSCASLRVMSVDVLNPCYSSLAGVLFNKNQTMLIQCPGAIAGTYAIPNGVGSIVSSAFRNCDSLNTVTIPNSVTNIGASAFTGCASLSVITVDALNSFYSSPDGVLFDKSQTTLIQCPGARAGVYTVPSSVTQILSTAFIGCSSLTVISVDTLNPVYSSLAGVLFDKNQTMLILCPEGMAGNYAVPNGVTNIGDYAFEACGSLTGVTIPSGVTGIGVGAFSDCSTLTNVTIPNSLTSIGSEAFESCSSLNSMTIPEGVTNIGVYAFYGCASLTSVTIPNSLTDISGRAFEGCTSLTSVTIGNNVTNVGSLAFAFCTNLTSVYFKGNAPTTDSTALANDNATVYYLSGTTGWGSTLDGLPAVLRNPQIQTSTASFGGQANWFGFSIRGPTNLVIVVEASTTLVSPIWSAVQTNSLVGGSTYFSDPEWTNYPVRFYRIRVP